MILQTEQVANLGESKSLHNDERNSYPASQEQKGTTPSSKEGVCNIRNLLKAEHRCRRSVGYKNSVSRFHMLNYSKCYKLNKELEEETYKGNIGFDFSVYEPRKRIVTTTPYRDRVPQASFIVNWWYDTVVPSLIENNFACMKNRGVDRARETLSKMLREAPYNYYCLKADLKDYFNSIPRERFVEVIFKDIDDPWAREFFSSVIHTNKGDKGISLGSEVHQLSATAFPNELDKLFGRTYERYMDDFIYIGTKEECEAALAQIEKWVAENGLILSAKKTRIQKISRPIKFLGFTFLKHESGRVTMKRVREGIKKERRKLRRMKEKGVPFERIQEHYTCIRSIMKKGCRSDLVKLDYYFNELFKEFL